MKFLKKSGIVRLLAGVLSLLFLFALTACGDVEEILPVVKNVTITAMNGAVYGKTGEPHLLSYETGEGDTVSVSVTKDDKNATAEDYSYTVASRTLLFKNAGKYTVTVYAAKNGLMESGKAEIEVAPPLPPVVSVSGENTVAEEEAIVIHRSVDYDEGDCAMDERVSSVEYKAEEDGTYAVANAALYSMEGDLFIPHDAGYFRINFEATGVRGDTGSASFEIHSTPANLVFTGAEQPFCIPVGVSSALDYTVSGPVDKFNKSISYDHEEIAVTSSEHGMKVKIDEENFASVKVTYTHKKYSSHKIVLNLGAYAVADVTGAPAFACDPFGGIPEDILTSMGYLLPANIARSSTGEALSTQNISYEVTEKNISNWDAANQSYVEANPVSVMYAAGDNAYPYLIVTNFDKNTAEGDFTMKITLTDPVTGKIASATRKFNVVPTTNDNDTAKAKIQSYVREHADYYEMGNLDYGYLCSDTRQNMVLTKTGTIMQRTNPGWPLHGSNGSENADFAAMNFASPSANCALEFKMTIVGTNSGKVQLGIGLRMGANKDWADFIDIVNGSDGYIKAEYGGGKTGETQAEASVAAIPAKAGTVLYVRLERTTEGGNAVYTIKVKTDGNAEYARLYSFTAGTSNKAGASVSAYQFTHRNGGGCYMIENVKLS